MSENLEALVIEKTFRVPVPAGPAGDGQAAARQLDAALMSAGFKCSRELLGRLGALDTGTVLDAGVRVIAAVRRVAGDNVRHNTYFRTFPSGVPDTMEFWVSCLRAALLDPVAAESVEGVLIRTADGREIAAVNLLSLPAYGRYQHSYEEMLAAHDELIPAVSDRMTVLHLGGTLDGELEGLYVSLAGSRVPLSEEDRGHLALLAAYCAGGPQPERIPVRENRAVINTVRLGRGVPLLADTVTDVLRLACAVSDGDVTLETPTRFRSFRRGERRVLLAALDAVVAGSRMKLGDAGQYREQWKRLGERLHPHEYPRCPHAQDVFAAARGDIRVPSFAARVEVLLGGGDVAGAAVLLSHAPGQLFRSLDRLLRAAVSQEDQAAVVEAAGAVCGGVSGRVLLSVREHFQNRRVRTDVSRVFANRAGRAWVAADTRAAFGEELLAGLLAVLDAEVASRVPEAGHLVIDPAVLSAALPLSGKAAAPGLGMLPRGSVSRVDGEVLRFFVYWKQRQRCTDYDLSALMLDDRYGGAEHISWTSYRNGYATYSGDLTDAADGATEFIDVELPKVGRRFIIPQVHIYSGEAFDEAEEAFFGFMLRGQEQRGAPFEARTVRMKSDLRGAGRVALPVVFMRGDDGKWRAKWLHLYMKGSPSFNTVERGKVTTGMLVRGIVERDYLRVRYLTDLMAGKAGQVTMYEAGCELGDRPVTFIGLERPDGLPEGSDVVTLGRLSELIPT